MLEQTVLVATLVGVFGLIGNAMIERKRGSVEELKLLWARREADRNQRKRVYARFVAIAVHFRQDAIGTRVMLVDEKQKFCQKFEQRHCQVAILGTFAAVSAAAEIAKLIADEMGHSVGVKRENMNVEHNYASGIRYWNDEKFQAAYLKFIAAAHEDFRT